MDRIIASLLVLGLAFASGCKKDKPKEKSESSTAATAKLTIPSKKFNAPPECRKLCMVVGKCTLRDGKCIATSTDACRAAYGCQSGGLCVAKDGQCIADSNIDCEKSDLCESEGRCIAVDGRCENKAVMPAGSGSAAPAGSAKPATSAN